MSTPRVTVFVELEIDGVPVEGFPYVRRIDVDDWQAFAYQLAGAGAGVYRTLPITRLDAVQGLIVATSEEVCLRFNGQPDGEIVLGPGGVAVLWETLLNHSPITNAVALRPQDGPTTLLGIAAGIGNESPRHVAPAPGTGFGAGGADEQGFGQ
jgi:hypothetical protein